MTGSIPVLIGTFIGQALFGSLIQALFLIAAASWGAKVNVSYGRAYCITFIITVIGGILSGILIVILGFLFASFHLHPTLNQILSMILASPVLIIIASAVYGRLLKDNSGVPIGMLKGMFTILIQFGLSIVVMAVIMGSIIGLRLLLK